MKLTATFSFIVAILLLTGCKDATHHKPNITGAMGEMLVVMDDRWRNGDEGEALRAILQQPMNGLPQIEPLFRVSITPHRAFSDNMRTFRNLVITTIDQDIENEGVRFFSETSWAKEQAMVHINARTPEKFIELVNDEELRILGFFLRAERQRSQKYYISLRDTDLTNMVKKKWGVDIVIPNTFSENQSSDSFTWLSHETPRSSQGLFIYSFDYKDESSLSRESLLNKRDSILRANVPGPTERSFMSTEHTVPITYKTLTVNNHNAIEIRGLWKVVGDLMGGPFVMFAHLDEANERIVVTDSYVYLPREPKKRNLVWQQESILYSVKFPKPSTE